MGLLDDRQGGLLAMQHNIDPRYKAAARAPAAQVLRGLLAPQQLAEMALAFAPGSGDAMAVRDGQQNFADMRKSIEGGDYGKAASDAIYGTTAYASALPVLGAAIPHFGGMVKAVRGAGKAADLPMDEASRMARADEHFPIDAYHGTRAEFDEFDRGDIGFHFGTEEQANERLRGTRRVHGVEGENVIPARLNIRNPVELPDVGEWDNPEVVAQGLLADSKWGKTRADALDDILSETKELSRQFEGVDEWKASDEAADLLSEIQQLMRDDGYDGVRYLNQVENQYGELSGFNRAAQKEYDALNKEYHELRKAIAGRRRDLPDGEVSEAALQEWLDQPSPKATAAEEARFEEIAAAKRRIEDTGRNSPYSYIAFDPDQIRSRFAKFDPKNRNSRDLLAGVAGAGLLAAPVARGMLADDQQPY